jgi:hypothetical protein
MTASISAVVNPISRPPSKAVLVNAAAPIRRTCSWIRTNS